MRRRRILSAILMCALLLQTQVSWAAAGEVWTSQEASSVEEASEESSIETQTPEEPSAEVQESEAPSAETPISEGSSTEVQTIETPASTQVAAQALKAPSTGTNRQTVQGDETYLSDVDINIVTDGTVPLDSNDEAGNDSSLNNGIVRSFDTVTYGIEVVTDTYDPNATYEQGKLYFAITIPATEKEAVFEPELPFIDGGEGDISVDTITGYQTLTGSYTIMPGDGEVFAVPGTASFSIPIKIRAMGNGEVLTPTAKFWMANNTTTGVCPEHGREEVVERSFPEVKISAALRLNVELRQADTTNTMTKGVFDFSQGNESALNKDKGEVYGQLFCYGITLQLYDPGSSEPAAKGLRGMELPEGDITLTLRLSSAFQVAGGQTYDADDPKMKDYQPLVYSLDENDKSSYTNSDGRYLGTVTGKQVGTPSAYRAGPLNQGSNDASCENGGTWEVVSFSGDQLTVKISGYSLDTLSFPGYADGLGGTESNRYYPSDAHLEDIQIGCFSAGEFWIVQPLENSDGVIAAEDLGGNGDFSITIEETLINAQSVTGIWGATK